jgi:hypothetical protein
MRARNAQAKRRDIEEQARRFDAELKREFGVEHFRAGYCLLLGCYYAQSDYVYFSLNPGFPRNGSLLNPESSAGYNVPFRNPEALRKQYVYLHNCQRFFSSYPQLNRWINNGITSAFLVPWRTSDTSELRRLNQLTHGRLFFHAGQLVKQIIRDHQAKLLVTAGKSALGLLEDLGVVEKTWEQSVSWGSGKSYQWSRCKLLIEGREISVLQIPHFSRANSPAKMRDLAGWLMEELKSFGSGRILASDGEP